MTTKPTNVYLTPVPCGASLAQIAGRLVEDLDVAAAARRIRQGGTVAECFREEQAALRALPERSFEARQVELVTVSRQALVRVDGAQYSVPSRWSSSQATAYVGVADIVLEWREERITITKQPRGARTVRYQHYLDELAAKPQAVRQVAPELMAELGAPYEQLWRLLSTRYGELEAARVVAKLVGAIVEHGEQLVAETLSAALTTPPPAPSAPRQPPATVPVPAALRRYRVEATPAEAYDALLAGGDR